MSTQVYITANTLSAYTTRRESWGGRDYIVAPVVMLVEGVHHGSAGPIFYPLNELRAFPASWNGRPVTLGHPEIEGSPVSAASPEAIEMFSLGILFNTRYDEALRGLRSEVWLDIARARRMAPDVLEAMQKGEPIEVSTGLWFDSQGGPGVWQNEEFDLTATSFRPDHLALLPGQEGACSISDGCGLRANKNKGGANEGNGVVNGNSTLEGNMDKSFWERFSEFIKNDKPPKEEQVAVLMKQFAVNQPGMLSVIRQLQTQLDALDRDMPSGRLIHYLEEAFDDGTFVLRQEGPEGRKFFKSAFTMTENEGVEFSEGDFTEVRRQEEFIDVSNTEPQTNKEDDDVSDTNTKKTLVDNLIACGKTAFTENHRAGLMAMEDGALEALKAPQDAAPAPAPAAHAAPAPAPAPAPVGNEQAGPKTIEEAVASLPQEHQGAINDALKANETRKEEAVKNILAAPGNTFTKEILNAKNLDEVLSIEALAKGDGGNNGTEPSDNKDNAPKANYSGAAPVNTDKPTGNEDAAAPLGRNMD